MVSRKGVYCRPESKQQTHCCYCSIEIRWDTLPKHIIQDFHPGLKKKREMGEKMRSIIDMLGTSRKRTCPLETDMTEEPQGATS